MLIDSLILLVYSYTCMRLRMWMLMCMDLSAYACDCLRASYAVCVARELCRVCCARVHVSLINSVKAVSYFVIIDSLLQYTLCMYIRVCVRACGC